MYLAGLRLSIAPEAALIPPAYSVGGTLWAVNWSPLLDLYLGVRNMKNVHCCVVVFAVAICVSYVCLALVPWLRLTIAWMLVSTPFPTYRISRKGLVCCYHQHTTHA